MKKNKINYNVALWFLLTGISNIAFGAYSIAEDEIKFSKPIQFQSYRGNPRIINTRQEVYNIGASLASIPDRSGETAQYGNKYQIIRVRDEKSDLYSADIFVIKQQAKANRIQDIRLIIRGLLEQDYGYSRNDSLAVATFITYYNGNYYNNMNYFKEKYVEEVLQNLPNKVGISTNYKEWPGNTFIVIPVSNGTKVLDAFEIGNKDIKDSLKQEDGKGVQERESLNKMQEKQIANSKQILADKQNEKIAQQDLITAQREMLEEKLAQAKTQEEKDKIQQKLDENTVAQKKLDEEVKNINEQEDKINKQEQIVKEDKKDIEQDKKDIEENKDSNKKERNNTTDKKSDGSSNSNTTAQNKTTTTEEKKDNNAGNTNNNSNNNNKDTSNSNQSPVKNATMLEPKNLQEVKELIENQKKEQAQSQQKEDQEQIYYLKKIDYYNGIYKNSQLATLDIKTRKLNKTSKLATVSGNQFDLLGNGIILVARENPKSETAHLTILDKDTLEIKTVGKDNVYPTGSLRIEGDSIFAIIEDNGNFYIGLFNADLNSVAKSNIAIDKDTFIAVSKDHVYVSKEDGSIIGLLKENLTVDDNSF